MTATTVERLVRRHNAVQLAIGVALLLGSVLLWIISFHLWKILYLMAFGPWAPFDVAGTSLYVAWGCTLVLLADGVRYARPLFDLQDYAYSIYCDNDILQTRTGSALNAYYGNPFGMAYVISQILFCAPRATVQGIKSLRSVIRVGADALPQAVRVHERLALERRWVPVSEFPDAGAGMFLLHRLGQIWLRIEGGEAQIRIPAAGPS